MPRLFIPLAGVLTFAVVYGVLLLGARGPEQPDGAAPTATPASHSSLAQRLGTGQVAVALPVTTAPTLVMGLQPGARLNVLASVPDPDGGRPLSAVVARGLTVVQTASPAEPLLVAGEPMDALVLAHLVLGGTPLTYSLWPGGVAPAEVPPIDERTARAVLGLPVPAATPVAPTAVPATPVPPPTPAPPRPATADRYVVQPGDTLPSIASQVGIPLDRMRAANPDVPAEGELPPGMQLVVPQ
jgi:LysM repeat protein